MRDFSTVIQSLILAVFDARYQLLDIAVAQGETKIEPGSVADDLSGVAVPGLGVFSLVHGHEAFWLGRSCSR